MRVQDILARTRTLSFKQSFFWLLVAGDAFTSTLRLLLYKLVHYPPIVLLHVAYLYLAVFCVYQSKTDLNQKMKHSLLLAYVVSWIPLLILLGFITPVSALTRQVLRYAGI